MAIAYEMINKDYKKAIVWYEKAYDMGYSGLLLGHLYHNILKDYKKAIYWYAKSFDRTNSVVSLAWVYDE